MKQKHIIVYGFLREPGEFQTLAASFSPCSSRAPATDGAAAPPPSHPYSLREIPDRIRNPTADYLFMLITGFFSEYLSIDYVGHWEYKRPDYLMCMQ
jgi:hypothetical protein